jgi:a component of the cytoplasm (encore)
MKESASPPRTPHSHSPNEIKSHSPTAPALVTTPDGSLDPSSPSAQLLAAPTFVLPQSESNGGKSQLDIEFPKLTPPKTKVGWSASSPPGSRNHNRKSVSSDTSSNNNSLSEDICESHVNEKTSQQQKTGSQINSTNNQSQYCDKKQMEGGECEQSSNNSVEYKHDERERVMISPSRAQCRSPNYSQNDTNNNGSKSSGAAGYVAVKGKPPLKNMGSSSSCEGASSGFISRDSSSEQFVDQNGIDLVQFFKETLNKNAKDRNMLMKIERDLIQLAVDQT